MQNTSIKITLKQMRNDGVYFQVLSMYIIHYKCIQIQHKYIENICNNNSTYSPISLAHAQLGQHCVLLALRQNKHFNVFYHRRDGLNLQ